MSAVAHRRVFATPQSRFTLSPSTMPASVAMMALLITSAFLTGCGSSSSGTPAMRASVSGTSHPLVAQITLQSWCAGQAMVEFGPDTNYGLTTSWSPISGGGQMSTILVAGMHASSTYHMRIQRQCSAGNSNSEDMSFTTGPLPSTPIPAPLVTRPPAVAGASENPGVELINITAPTANMQQSFVTDRDGNPIWYYDVGANNAPFPYKLMPNGHMLFAIGFGGVLAPTSSVLREVDLAGHTVRELDAVTLGQRLQAAGYDITIFGYHHELIPMDNGHVIALISTLKTFSNLTGYPANTSVQGDGIVDLDENWNPVWAWNSFDYLDPNRHPAGLPDWTHSNGLVYLPNDGNLLISMRHQSWILKIDYNNGAGTGHVLWTLGNEGSFALTQNGAPTSDPSLWFYYQHFPSLITQNGPVTSLAVWDNGDSRILDSSGDYCQAPGQVACYSRATIFQIDESAMVADLSWAYAPGNFSVWGGNILQLANGNVEFNLNAPLNPPDSANASEIWEVTQTASPQLIWKMNIPLPTNAYRAYRIPSLYPGVTWP